MLPPCPLAIAGPFGCVDQESVSRPETQEGEGVEVVETVGKDGRAQARMRIYAVLGGR